MYNTHICKHTQLEIVSRNIGNVSNTRPIFNNLYFNSRQMNVTAASIKAIDQDIVLDLQTVSAAIVTIMIDQ